MPVVAVLEKLLLQSANGESTLGIGELTEELQLYKNDIDLAKLKLQLLTLPDLIRARNSKSPNTVSIRKVTNVYTICEVMNDVGIGKKMLSDVFRLLQIFFTLPVMTATAERMFSALRHLKTKLRSTMSQPRLNHTMLLYIHKDRTDKINDMTIAKQFIMENDRRTGHFGSM